MIPPSRPTGIALATALGFLLPGAVAMGQTASGVPTADDFQIFYYTVDYNSDGEPQRGRLMTAQDLEGSFVNQARCECGQEIWIRIILRPGSYPVDQVRTFVGNRCDEAQGTFNPQFDPCVKIEDSIPQAYRNGVDKLVHPVWLARGVVDVSAQGIGVAVAAGDCSPTRGDAGVWICFESNGQPDCQPDEFIIRGDRNENTPDGQSQPLSYDFDPPFTLPNSVRVESGDQAVIVRWNHDTPDPSGGYRVLCADANGNPVPGKGFNLNSITAVNLGNTYFTEENLCPEGPFSEVPMTEPTTPPPGPPDPEPEPDPDPDGDDGDPTAGFDGWPEPVSFQETGTGAETDDTGTTGDTGTGTTGDTDTATGTDTGEASGGVGPSDAAVAALESLDWSYVCSDHLPYATNNTRVSGLQNGVQYSFMLVAYDRAGNPVAASPVLTGVPRDTIDLWEQCEIAGQVCGEGGYCACQADDPRPMGALASLFGLLLGAGGVWRRKRRRAR